MPKDVNCGEMHDYSPKYKNSKLHVILVSLKVECKKRPPKIGMKLATIRDSICGVVVNWWETRGTEKQHWNLQSRS